MKVNKQEFNEIVESKIKTGEKMYIDLLENVISNPHRFIGIFRLSNVNNKFIQNVTQSNEIKLGDILEELITLYLDRVGMVNLNKNLASLGGKKKLLIDQIFTNPKFPKNIYFIEQKIRDDHDSSKKEGQFKNFIKKLDTLKAKYPNNNILAYMWFIDRSLQKNRNYYLAELQEVRGNYFEMDVFYGPELLEKLQMQEVWQELVNHLTDFRNGMSNEPLYIPNFDTSEEIFEAMKKISRSSLNKLVSNTPSYLELRKTLFPSGFNIERIKNFMKR